jgi:uncharacterized DUF497 family protein
LEVVVHFDWDPNKNYSNRRKHGIDFEEAKTVFDDPLAVSIVDDEHSFNEERWLTIGMSSHGKLLVVAHTYVPLNGEELIRIINARGPTIIERDKYEEEH